MDKQQYVDRLASVSKQQKKISSYNENTTKAINKIYNGTAYNGTVPVSKEGYTWWSAKDAMTISSSILIFGLLSLVIASNLMRKTSITADGILKIFGMILLIFGSLFLVVSGYSKDQIGPVMGLLGTIAGFIFGRASSGPPGNPQPEKDDQDRKKEK